MLPIIIFRIILFFGGFFSLTRGFEKQKRNQQRPNKLICHVFVDVTASYWGKSTLGKKAIHES